MWTTCDSAYSPVGYCSGEAYQEGDPPELIPLGNIEKISIQHGQSRVVSFCGSATFGLGVEGMLDLYHDQHWITSVYWNGPWNRVGNQFHLTNVDNKSYRVTASMPSDEGILGDLAVEVGEVHACHSLYQIEAM